jgi:hypothetical protein
MSPAARESVRVELDRVKTPDGAPARKLLERPLMWRCEGSDATVRLVASNDGRARIVISDGRSSVSVRPSDAFQVASLIDVAIERIDPQGRIRRCF